MGRVIDRRGCADSEDHGRQLFCGILPRRGGPAWFGSSARANPGQAPPICRESSTDSGFRTNRKAGGNSEARKDLRRPSPMGTSERTFTRKRFRLSSGRVEAGNWRDPDLPGECLIILGAPATTLRSKSRSLGTPGYHPKKQKPLLGDPRPPPQQAKTASWGPRRGKSRLASSFLERAESKMLKAIQLFPSAGLRESKIGGNTEAEATGKARQPKRPAIPERAPAVHDPGIITP
jgi:hypothetical protein